MDEYESLSHSKWECKYHVKTGDPVQNSLLCSCRKSPSHPLSSSCLAATRRIMSAAFYPGPA